MHFGDDLKNWQRESCFTRTMLLHTGLVQPGCNGWFAWLRLWSGWSPSIFSLFGTSWLISVPQHEKTTTLGWEAASDRWWGHNYLQLRTFSRIRMRASVPRESMRCNTDGRTVWTTGNTMLKNKPHLVRFDRCIIVSLWTFQPTLALRYQHSSVRDFHL